MEAESAMSIAITPSGQALGAEVSGLNLAAGLAEAELRTVNDAFLKYQMLVFRGQRLNAKALAKFARYFGPIQPHVLDQYHHPDEPAVSILSNVGNDGVIDPDGARRGEGWHTDFSYAAIPSKATFLHSEIIPSRGGDTLFCNMYRVWEDLGTSEKAKIRGLRAYFSWNGRNKDGVQLTEAQRALLPEIIHPIAPLHPETGRRSIYVDTGNTTAIVGIDSAESEALLEHLFDRATQPDNIYRHVWQLGDLIMWDNRCTLHEAAGNYPPNEVRRMIRATVEGTAPTA